MSAIAISCRVCGLEFALGDGQATGECPACGTVHGRPRSGGEGLEWLRRANSQRAACDFAHAEADYRSVLIRQPDEHEALWGLVMCKYGVEFVTDPRTQERRPVLHFLRRRPITEDADFRRACAWAPEEIAERYRADAQYISQIQQQLLRPEADEHPCDIFLCYKGSAPDGKGRAREYEHAREMYYHLKETGYRVFFAHESLKRVAGANYEARIYHALHSAAVMLVICSDAANLTTPWVRSEWSRYLERVDAGEKCRLIPLLYDGCDPYTLPDEFVNRSLQALRMDELTSLDALRANLRKLVKPALTVAAADGQTAGQDDAAEKLLSIEYALANASWSEAEKLSAGLIREQPKCAMAYLCKLLARLQLSSAEKLRTRMESFEGETDWQWAVRLGTPEEKERLKGILNDSLALRRQQEEAQLARERQRKEAEARWQALGKAFEDAAGNGRWDEARKCADEMKAMAPENPRGYLSSLLTEMKLSHPGALGECQQAFEESADWKRTLELSSPEDGQHLKTLLKQSRKMREAFIRNQLRAEHQRQEEEQRIAREAEEAEKQRVREAQRREEEELRRQREKEIDAKAAEVRNQLENKIWSGAVDSAAKMPDCPQKPLLQLLAKYRATSEQALLFCDKPFHLDPLWEKALEALPARREELEQIEKTRTKRVGRSRAWKFGALYGLATLVVLYMLSFFLGHTPYELVVTMGVSVLAFDAAIWFRIRQGHGNSAAGIVLGMLLMLLATVGVIVFAVVQPNPLGIKKIISAALSLIALVVYLHADWTLKLDRWCIRWQLVWLALYLCVAVGLWFWSSNTLETLYWLNSHILPAVVAVRQGMRFGSYHSRERRPRSA